MGRARLWGRRERFGLAAFEGFQQGVEGSRGGRGGGDVAGAVAFGEGAVHAEAPGGGGGVVGGEGLDTEHDLDFVAGVEGGEGLQGAVDAAVGLGLGVGWVFEGEGSDEGSDGFVDEGWVDGAVFVEEDGGWLGQGCHVSCEFLLCSK